MFHRAPTFMLGHILILNFWVRTNEAANAYANSNAREFGILCKLYRLAERGLEKPSTPQFGVAKTLVGQIRGLYVLAAGNESEYSSGIQEFPESLKESVHRIQDSSQRVILGTRLKRILNQATAIENRVKQAIDNVQTFEIETNTLLKGAIYGGGEGSEPAGEKSFSDKKIAFGAADSLDTDKSCGGSGASGGNRGDYVGTSLANDFLCLCFEEGGTNEKYCGGGVGGTTTDWMTHVINAASTHWTKIEAACPQYKQDTTVESLESALGAFHARIGASAHGNSADTDTVGPFLFGWTAAFQTGCTGAPQQVCVNYKKPLSKGGSGISWEKKIIAAQGRMKEINTQLTLAESLLHRLEDLNESARVAYESAQATIGLEKGSPLRHSQTQSQKQNLTTSTNKASAHEPNAVSGSPIARFILPWTLLL